MPVDVADHLSRKIRVRIVNACVDDRDGCAAASDDPSLVGSNLQRAILRSPTRISRGHGCRGANVIRCGALHQGVASQLRDEGIDVMALPMPAALKETLQ